MTLKQCSFDDKLEDTRKTETDSRHVVRHHDGLGNVARRDVPAQKLRGCFLCSRLFEINFLVSLSVTGGHFALQEKRKRIDCTSGQGKSPPKLLGEIEAGVARQKEKKISTQQLTGKRKRRAPPAPNQHITKQLVRRARCFLTNSSTWEAEAEGLL